MKMNFKPIRSAALALAAALALPVFAGAGTAPREGFPAQPIRISAPERARVVMGPAGRAWLGIQMLDLNEELREFFGAPQDAGLLISGVTGDSPAAEAGFRVGDVVTRIGEQSAGSSRDVVRAVSRLEPEETVAIEVVRDGAPLTLSATLGEREPDTWFSRGFGAPDMIMFRRDSLPEAFRDFGETPEAVAEALAEAGRRMNEIEFSELTEEAVREAIEAARERMSEFDYEALRERLAATEERLRELERKLAERER